MKSSSVRAQFITVALGLLLFVSAPPVWSFGSTSGADYLTQEFSARSAGQSSAYVSKAMDVSTVLVNPSAISYMRFPQVHYHHDEILGGFANEFVSIGIPTETFLKRREVLPKEMRFLQQMRWGMHVAIGHTEQIPVYGNDFDDPTTNLDAGYWIFGLTGAYNLRSYRLGMTLKFFNQTLGDYSGGGVAVDLGSQKAFEVPRFIPYPRRNNLRVGLAINNIGLGGVTYTGQGETADGTNVDGVEGASEDVPMVVKPSATYGVYGDRIHMLDYSMGFNYYMLDGTLSWVNGIEYRIFNVIYFRFGYEIAGNENNITLGTGGKYTFRKVKYRLDYAYLPRVEGVDDNHTFGLQAELQFFTSKRKKRISSIGILEGEEEKPSVLDDAPKAQETPKLKIKKNQ